MTEIPTCYDARRYSLKRMPRRRIKRDTVSRVYREYTQFGERGFSPWRVKLTAVGLKR